MIEESTSKLLQEAIPPVRYHLLKEVMNKDNEDLVLKKAIDDCTRYRPKLLLLRKIREDGTWQVSKRHEVLRHPYDDPRGWVYTVIMKNLHKLLDYNTSRDEGMVNLVLEKVLSWQTKEGFIPGDWTYSIPLPPKNGCILHELCGFGLGNDPRVKRIAEWLVSMQRPDGGWNIPYRQDLFYERRYRQKGVEWLLTSLASGNLKYDPKDYAHVPSCHWSTLFVLWGLSVHPQTASSWTTTRGASFLLGRFFLRNPHPGFFASESNWTKLSYPPFEGGGLIALDVLTKLGHGFSDERMAGPVKWLLSSRSSDGFWRKQSHPYREADQWITLVALRVLVRCLENQSRPSNM